MIQQFTSCEVVTPLYMTIIKVQPGLTVSVDQGTSFADRFSVERSKFQIVQTKSRLPAGFQFDSGCV
jgi:hypothetical protein